MAHSRTVPRHVPPEVGGSGRWVGAVLGQRVQRAARAAAVLNCVQRAFLVVCVPAPCWQRASGARQSRRPVESCWLPLSFACLRERPGLRVCGANVVFSAVRHRILVPLQRRVAPGSSAPRRWCPPCACCPPSRPRVPCGRDLITSVLRCAARAWEPRAARSAHCGGLWARWRERPPTSAHFPEVGYGNCRFLAVRVTTTENFSTIYLYLQCHRVNGIAWSVFYSCVCWAEAPANGASWSVM